MNLAFPKLEPLRSEPHRRYVAAMPCMICGRPDVQCAHIRNIGASIKCCDSETVPFCLECHKEFDGMPGRERFQAGENKAGLRFSAEDHARRIAIQSPDPKIRERARA